MTASEALDVLKAHLREFPPYPLNDDGDYVELDGSYASDPSQAADLARQWCRELLAEAKANGMGGCKLCRS